MHSCTTSRTRWRTSFTSAIRRCRSRPARTTATSTRRMELLMAETIREGGCGCGHVRYRARGEPMMVHNCHCRLCQQQTGSTSVVNAFFESDRVQLLQGALTEHEVKTGSGKAHIICRCGQC